MLKKIECNTKNKKNSNISSLTLLAVFEDYTKLIARRSGNENLSTTTIGHELTKTEKKEIGTLAIAMYKTIDYRYLSLLCDVIAKDGSFEVPQQSFILMLTEAFLKKQRIKKNKMNHDELVALDNNIIDELIERDIEQRFTISCIQNEITIDEKVLTNVCAILLDILKTRYAINKTEGCHHLLQAIINHSTRFTLDKGLKEISYISIARALEEIDLPEDPEDKEIAITQLKVKEMEKTSGKRL